MLAITLLLCSLPDGNVEAHTIDAMEINHVYNECGKLNFTQVIFWHWSNGSFHVASWVMLRPGMVLKKCQRSGAWTLTWNDGGKLRTVRSVALLETWTTYDIEVAERSLLPCQMRRGLR
jgi:hypothetical protein